MKSFNKDGLRFIIGTLVAAVTAVLVASIISTSLGTLAEAIRESNANSSAPSSSITSSSSPSSSTNGTSSTVTSSEVEIHQITFNPSGGSAVNPTTLQVRDGEFILNFPVSTLANHTFLGWFTGVTPNDVLFTGTMPVVQDMTLFARWQLIVDTPPVVEPGTVTWRVAFNAAGGSPVDTVQVSDGRTMQLPLTTRTGYVFLGWFTGNLPGDIQFTASMIINRDMTLFARWERESFMITFLTYGGSFVAPITAKADSPITAPANPTKQNFSFGGWFTTADYSTEFEFSTMPSASTTLHALWTPGTFEGLRYSCSTTECIVTGYEGIHSAIYIPAEIDGLPVTTIANNAFEGNDTLVSITFEDEEGASSAVTTIGIGAFSNMSSLRDLVLPQTALRTIRNDAFRNSGSLTAIDIPYGVTTLGTNVLTGADSIQRISYSPENNRKVVNTGFNFKYLFGVSGFTASPVIPTSIETIIITEGTTFIPNDGLRELPMFTTLVAPVSLNSYGTNLLTGATNLQNLTWTFTSGADNNSGGYLSYLFGNAINGIANMPAGLRAVTINPKAGVTRLIPYAFYNVGTLEEINLPSTITVIGAYALAHVAVGTARLRYIDLPENLLELGTHVFNNSSALLELEIPNSVTTIGSNLVTGANALTKLTYSNNSLPVGTRFLRYLFGGSVASGAVPATLKTVEITTGDALVASYFESVTSIETVFLPSTIATINNRAFFGMTALRQVAVLGSIATPDRVILPSALTTLGTSVFQNAANIRHVTIPDAITQIPVDTFNGATELTTLVTGPSMTVIGDRAFLNTKLSTFTFANNLTTIGISAFQGTLMTNVVVPNSVTIIGNDAFRNMNALTSITFPSVVPTSPSVFSLGTNVLTGAQVLTTINTHINVLPSATNVLRYFFGGTITVNTGTLPTTLTTVNLTGGTTLTGSFFQNATAIVNVTLPNTLTIIGVSAFEGATGIKNLTIPATVDNLGASAFRAMTGLVQLTFLRETLPTTIGLTLFTISSVNAAILAELFIIVPNATAVTTYSANAQFNAFATQTPTRLVAAQGEPEIILP